LNIKDAHELFVNQFFNHKNSIFSIEINGNQLKVKAKRQECLDEVPNLFESFEVLKELK